jgi:hypothetical protein
MGHFCRKRERTGQTVATFANSRTVDSEIAVAQLYVVNLCSYWRPLILTLHMGWEDKVLNLVDNALTGCDVQYYM